VQELNPNDFLNGKSEDTLVQIAQRTGQILTEETISLTDRRAAEEIARALALQALERVRRELSFAIRNAKTLPKNLAIQLAHDVDAVAVPFLELTEVFSDSEWRSLILTISRRARIAVAQRESISEAIALPLAQLGDSDVVRVLIDNPKVPMDGGVCPAILKRFETDTEIIDQLAQREDLLIDIVVELISLVSQAMRRKLESRYRIPAMSRQLASESENAAILRLISNMPAEELHPVIDALRRDGKLNPQLVLNALRKRYAGFPVAVLSNLANRDLDHVRRILNRGKRDAVIDIMKRARFPDGMHAEIWSEIEAARNAVTF
jgi:uncharacterized protein (DUF2336 family)